MLIKTQLIQTFYVIISANILSITLFYQFRFASLTIVDINFLHTHTHNPMHMALSNHKKIGLEQ